MFKKIISRTPLSNNIADEFFDNVYGDSFNRDVSFISTLRALVVPRMQEGERLRLSFCSSSYDAEQISSGAAARTLRAVCGTFRYDESGVIYIHSFNAIEQADNYANLALVETTFESAYNGWKRLEKVTEFFVKQFKVLCYINPEQKSAALFVDKMDIRRMHYLQTSILAFLPWYFDPDKGIDQLELELIKSLLEKTSEHYEALIAKIAERYDFRSERIRKLLNGFETRFERAECDNVREEIRDYEESLERLNCEYGEVLGYKSAAETRLLGLEAKIARGSDDSEIMEYFLCNKKVELTRVSDSSLVFIARDYLTYYDEEMAKSVINNNTSYVYMPHGRTCNNYMSEEDMKRLMTAIFLDNTLKIKFCAAYKFDLRGTVYACSNYDFGQYGVNHMPNPHINIHSCLGNYQRTINNILKDKNYIGAVEQCIASCKSLNFGDSIVMQEFMDELYGINNRGDSDVFIELPDGTMVNPKDAVKWLKEQEGASNE